MQVCQAEALWAGLSSAPKCLEGSREVIKFCIFPKSSINMVGWWIWPPSRSLVTYIVLGKDFIHSLATATEQQTLNRKLYIYLIITLFQIYFPKYNIFRPSAHSLLQKIETFYLAIFYSMLMYLSFCPSFPSPPPTAPPLSCSPMLCPRFHSLPCPPLPCSALPSPALLFPLLPSLSSILLFILKPKTIERNQIILPVHGFKMVRNLHAKCSNHLTDVQTVSNIPELF